MGTYVLHHQHTADECEAAFAAWSGFDSPLRGRGAASTCLTGGHSLWWHVQAESLPAALTLLPPFVRERTVATAVRDVVIP